MQRRWILVLSVFAGLCVAAGLATIAGHHDRPVLKIATNEWLGYEPLYIAADTGHLEAGRIQLTALPSTTEVIRALHHGAIDGAALTLDETLQLVADGVDLTVVAVADISDGADAVLLRSDLPPDTSLQGLSLGYEDHAVGAYMAARFLARSGLTLSDVRLVLSPPDRHAEELERHTLDAVVTYEPFVGQLRGITRPLFTSREIPGEIIDVLVLRQSAATPEAVEALRQAWLSGVANLNSATPDLMKAVAKRHRLSPEALSAALPSIAFADPPMQVRMLGPVTDGAIPQLLQQASLLWSVMKSTGLAADGTPMPGLILAPFPHPAVTSPGGVDR